MVGYQTCIGTCLIVMSMQVLIMLHVFGSDTSANRRSKALNISQQ
jgi:hypothetical protein